MTHPLIISTYIFAAAIVMIAGETAMAGWYTDSIKTATIIEIRGETADSAAAREQGDRYIDDNLDYLLANNEWLIVNFCAYWCGDCNNFRPDFLKASEQKEYAGIRWAHADVDGVRGNENLRKRFNLPGTPTVILFHKGEAIATLDGHEGDKGYDDLIALLKSSYRP